MGICRLKSERDSNENYAAIWGWCQLFSSISHHSKSFFSPIVVECTHAKHPNAAAFIFQIFHSELFSFRTESISIFQIAYNEIMMKGTELTYTVSMWKDVHVNVSFFLFVVEIIIEFHDTGFQFGKQITIENGIESVCEHKLGLKWNSTEFCHIKVLPLILIEHDVLQLSQYFH